MYNTVKQTTKTARDRMAEPTTLGQLMEYYTLHSDEPFAQLLRQCHCCQQEHHCSPQPTTSLYEWVDNQEVMQTLNISLRTLQNLRSQGVLPYSVLGGRCFYKRKDLERLLEQGYRIDGNTTTYVEKGGWRDDE